MFWLIRERGWRITVPGLTANITKIFGSIMNWYAFLMVTVKIGWFETDESCLYCGLQSVESAKHIFFSCPLAQQVWRYAVNITWQLFAKMITLVLGNLSQCRNASLMSLLACHCHPLVEFGFSWGVVSPWLFGVIGMTWCLTLFNGQWKKHTKLCGITCLSLW